MEARLNHVLIGVFFVLSLFALAYFVYWIGRYDRNISKYNEYYVYNTELPKGIRSETQVRFLGIPVGFVKSYKLIDDNVEMVIWIKKDINIKKGAKIIVDSQGLTSGNFLSLIQGNEGDFTQGEKAILGFEENWVDRVGNKVEKAMEQLETSLYKVNMLLNDKNLQNIESSLENFAKFSQHLDRTLLNIESEILKFGNTREVFEESIKNGDYNLREMITPLIFDLQQSAKRFDSILQSTQSITNEIESSPYDFIFGIKTNKLGPREER